MKATEILAYLDNNFSAKSIYTFASIEGNGFDLADARMTVFRDTLRWVLIFEFVDCNAITGDCSNRLSIYGNEIGRIGFVSDYSRVLFEYPDDVLLQEEDSGEWILSKSKVSVLINGQHLTFTPSPEDYAEANIYFTGSGERSNYISPTQILRYLCHKLNHPFFVSEDYLRYVIDACRQDSSRSLAHTLALFIQTNNWTHPLIDQFPSNIETFRLLAFALETGNLTEWQSQKKDRFNMFWGFWDALNENTNVNDDNRVLQISQRTVK